MKITFLTDHQSPQSGNELYQAGAHADLPQGQALIDSGVAYAGWGQRPMPESDPQLEEQAIVLDGNAIEQLSDDELRELAKANKVPNYWSMKRETLLERLL